MIDAAIWRMITGNKWDRGQSVKEITTSQELDQHSKIPMTKAKGYIISFWLLTMESDLNQACSYCFVCHSE